MKMRCFVGFGKIIFVAITGLFFRKFKYIVFESFPECGGSPWMIYKEFIARGLFKNFELIWAVDKSYKSKEITVNTIPFFGNLSIREKIKRRWILFHTKLIVDSNRYIDKLNPETFRLYTQHGSPIKRVFDYTFKLQNVDAVLSLSDEMSVLEHRIWPSAKGCFEVLGYPSNDVLFERVDLYRNGFWKRCSGCEKRFNKIIGWFPTFRQHRKHEASRSNVCFPFGVPLLKLRGDFELINVLLKKKNVLLVIQIHHAQADNFPKQNYSNIVLIPSSLKEEMKISNANLMSNFDALITDYSGAYHEYLLLNRPIALSIDDYDEYAKNPGFSIDYFDLIKGVYLKDTSDLVHFIEDVANGVDSAKDEREKSMRRIHKYIDGQSTKRVVDFLIEKAKL